MGPAILGNAAVQINVMVNTNFASGIADPVRGAGRSGELAGLCLPLHATAAGPVRRRHRVGHAAGHLAQRGAGRHGRIPADAVALAGHGVPADGARPRWAWSCWGSRSIGAIYQGGKFQLYDTQQTALALSCYAIGLAGYSALKVLTPAFYALQRLPHADARQPGSILINYVAASTHDPAGRAWARGPGAVHFGGGAVRFPGAVLDSAQPHRRHSRPRAGRLAGRDPFASAVMAASRVWLSSHAIQAWLGAGKLGYLTDVAVSIPLGALVYYLAGRLFRIEELRLAWPRGRVSAPPVLSRGGGMGCMALWPTHWN